MPPTGPLPGFSLGRLLLGAAAMAGVPLLALAGLWISGTAAGSGVLVAGLCVLAAAMLLSAIWLSDLARLTDTLRRVAADDPPAPTPPLLPPVEEIARGIERLSVAMRERGALVGRLVRADAGIVERLPDPLIVLGADRAPLRANGAARTTFGTDMAAVLRHPVLRGATERAFQTGEPQTASLYLPVPVERELALSVIPMDPPLADGGRAVVVLSDRTRERAVERMRADFVTNASHELRTPLASLIGFIDTLRGPAADDPDAQKRFLGIMAEQAARMNRLIDDLLSLSRIELSEHEAPRTQADLADLARRAAAGFEPRVADRGITLDCVPDAGLRPVPGDPDQLMQVLSNLLENAMKYGREKGLVRLSITPAEPGGRWPSRPGVVIAVADDGPGIAREHLPRLTERFYRVDKGRSRGVGGTGLGLAIVKHIVNRHRGQLAIDSTEGQGTTVSVWLPATEPETTHAGGSGDD